MFWRILCVSQFYLLLVVYTYLGLTPHPEQSIPVYNDLLMHFTGYAVAAVSISFARPLWPIWQQALLLVIYSFAIEVAQHFNPPRTFSLMDMLANSAGVILGLALILLLQKQIPLFAKLLLWNTTTNKPSFHKR